MVSRSIPSLWLPLWRGAPMANAIAVGALLIVSASPGAATAATVSVEPTRFYPLEYLAAPGERNDVLVVYNNSTNRDVTITDASAPLTAGKSCSALDVNSVRCSYDFGPNGLDLSARVKLGDLADRLRVRKPSAAGGDESYPSAFIVADGGPGPDVLSGNFGLDE